MESLRLPALSEQHHRTISNDDEHGIILECAWKNDDNHQNIQILN
jgi:hypothetical protein